MLLGKSDLPFAKYQVKYFVSHSTNRGLILNPLYFYKKLKLDIELTRINLDNKEHFVLNRQIIFFAQIL